MGSVYVDTSAIGHVLLGEPDTPAVERALEAFGDRVSSVLLRIELRRVALRRGMPGRAEPLLAPISLISIDDEIVAMAETIMPSSVATLDAIHLATAVRLSEAGELDALMTYDKRLADGAREHGIEVLSPA